jgi:uncharacterized protein (TIGR02266 family)
MVDTDAERRRHRRVVTRARCWVERESVTLYGRIVDIGEGGLFLRTAVSLVAGTPVDVYVAPEGSEQKIRARGTVAWSGLRTDGAKRTSGIGIAFESVIDGQEFLDRLLDTSPDA